MTFLGNFLAFCVTILYVACYCCREPSVPLVGWNDGIAYLFLLKFLESLDEDENEKEDDEDWDVKIMYLKRKKKRNEMSIYLFVNVGAVLCAFYDGIRSQKIFYCLVSNFCMYFYKGVVFCADVST